MAGILLVLPRIALRAFYALRNGMIDINCLMTIASLGACALELAGSDAEGGYLEGAAVLVLFSLHAPPPPLTTGSARAYIRSRSVS